MAKNPCPEPKNYKWIMPGIIATLQFGTMVGKTVARAELLAMADRLDQLECDGRFAERNRLLARAEGK